MTGSSVASFDLTEAFAGSPDKRERIGIELEYGLVRPASGENVTYDEPNGACTLLETLLIESGGEPVLEDGNLLAVKLPNGSEVSLEPGAAIEYSSAPYESVAEVVAVARSAVAELAKLAGELDIAMLPGGLLPFTDVRDIKWIPKRRVQVMRDFFRSLGEAGADADGIMGLTTSAQTTLDYTSEADFSVKLRMLVGVSPIVAALFVNSPIEVGEISGVLSRRLQLWRRIAPPRCGVLKLAVGRNPTIEDLAEWVSSQPMIYRSMNGRHVSAPPGSFASLLADADGGGSCVTRADWESQLNQVWPHVRARRTLELRIADGIPWPYFGAVPALWTGLTYNEESLRDALSIASDWTWAELESVTDEVAVKGLSAMIGQWSVRDVAAEFVRLAQRGLVARVSAGKEETGTIALLDPLVEIVESGQTFAERCIDQWMSVIGEKRDQYVKYYRI